MVAIVDETFCGHTHTHTPTHTHTHTHTHTQVILYLSNAMNCIGQTKNETIIPAYLSDKYIGRTDIRHVHVMQHDEGGLILSVVICEPVSNASWR